MTNFVDSIANTTLIKIRTNSLSQSSKCGSDDQPRLLRECSWRGFEVLLI